MNGERRPPRQLPDGLTNTSYQTWWVKWQDQVVRCQSASEGRVALRAMQDGWQVSRGGDPDFFMSRGTERKFVEVKSAMRFSDVQQLRIEHLRAAGLQVDTVFEPSMPGDFGRRRR